MKRFITTAVLVLAAAVLVSARQERAPSPAGTAQTVVGGAWVKNPDGTSAYQGG
jgi:hypothetical protein